jgi:hypothetical protein
MKYVQKKDWTEYRNLPLCVEVDFHRSERGPREIPYDEAMQEVWDDAFDAIQKAYRIGLRWILFTPGSSTSRPGATTARSQVRKLVRDKSATPYIVRAKCEYGRSFYVVAIRENPNVKPPDVLCPACGSDKYKKKSEAGHFECTACHKNFNWFGIK